MIDLKKLLSEYPELLHDRQRLRGILLDLNTELADRPKINLLMSIYDLGIVNEIESAPNDTALVSRMVTKARNQLFLDEKMAEWAVKEWCGAFEIKYSSVPVKTLKPAVSSGTNNIQKQSGERKAVSPQRCVSYNTEDFFIEDNVLKQYKGKADEVIIPDGVTEISYDVFRDCTSLTYNILSRTNYTSGKILYVKPSAATKCPSILSTTVPTDSVSFIYIVGIGREIFSPPIATFSLEPLAKATESGEIYGEICLCRISKEKFTFAVLPCKHIGEEKV